MKLASKDKNALNDKCPMYYVDNAGIMRKIVHFSALFTYFEDGLKINNDILTIPKFRSTEDEAMKVYTLKLVERVKMNFPSIEKQYLEYKSIIDKHPEYFV